MIIEAVSKSIFKNVHRTYLDQNREFIVPYCLVTAINSFVITRLRHSKTQKVLFSIHKKIRNKFNRCDCVM